jgi:tetratricopeptide (TPR) repeat protein
MDYLDFDLLIERAPEGYTVRVLSSPAGQARAQFSLPFSDLELENFLLRVGRTRRGVRRLESPEMEAAKAFGGRLFDAVFEDDVRGCLHSSLDEANRRGKGLRIRLRTAGTPELTDLPWEYLYNPGLNRFLVLSSGTPVVRYLDLPERVRPLEVKPPLRVLVMISSPSNYPPLDVEQEWKKLRKALRGLEQRRLVTLERLEEATLIGLQRRLRRGEYHIFHFVGHGGFDEQAQDGVLLLEDESGQGRPVSGQYLGTLMHDERTLRLAILNACEGARTSRTDPFAGTAQSLVQQGVPAVIAMQFEITDEAAITLAHEFYAALVDGYPVDAALAEARKAIFAQENDVEWGTPVLYMRSPDGHIFDIEQTTEEEREESQVAALYQEAQAAMTEEDWAKALERLQSLLSLDPDHVEATSALKHARQQQKLDNLYTNGVRHYEAGRWHEALRSFRQVRNVSGDYRDVSALIAAAETKMTAEEKTPSRESPLLGFLPPGLTRRGWIAIPVVLALLCVICGGGALLVRSCVSTATPTPSEPTAIPITMTPTTKRPTRTSTSAPTSTRTTRPTDTPTPTRTTRPTDTPTPTETVDDIRSFRVTNVSDKESLISVDYTYRSDHGNAVFLGAYALQGGQRLPWFGFAPASAQPGEGRADIRLTFGFNDPPDSVSTDQIEIDLYVGGGSTFYSEVFDYEQTWTTTTASGRSTTVNSIAGEGGHVRSDGTVNPYPNMGDTSDNKGAQAFLSFDISGIPSGATVSDVVMEIGSYDTLGDPFGSALGDGCLRAYTHDYGAVDAGDYTTGRPLGALVRWCSSSELDTPKEVPGIAEALQSQLGQARFQMRLQFNPPESNGNGTADMVRLGPVSLKVTYQTP